MGFLKRLFSIGTKNGKKERKQYDRPSLPPAILEYPVTSPEDAERVSNHLLRSSSKRFAVVSELDCASLPPIPHPIDRVVNPASMSRASLASTTHLSTMTSTYRVKVGPRIRHSSTEFPMSYSGSVSSPSLPLTGSVNGNQLPLPADKRDSYHDLALRSNPSVASLLNMYDEHGCLDSHAFSASANSPENSCAATEIAADESITESYKCTDNERAQLPRSGSTLRQLLGADANNLNSTAVGDISWADKLLEQQSDSSEDSAYLPTPLDTRFPHSPSASQSVLNVALSPEIPNNTTFFSEFSHQTSAQHPIFSSLEVEFSGAVAGTDENESSTQFIFSPYTPSPFNAVGPRASVGPYGASAAKDASSPPRASQVFGFLLDKKSTAPSTVVDDERPSPTPRSPHFPDENQLSSERKQTLGLPCEETRGELEARRAMSSIGGAYKDPYSTSGNMAHLQGSMRLRRSHSTSAADILRDGPIMGQACLQGPRPAINSLHPMTYQPVTDLEGEEEQDEPIASTSRHVSQRVSMYRASTPPSSTHMISDPYTPNNHRRTSSTASVVDFEYEEYVPQHPAPKPPAKRASHISASKRRGSTVGKENPTIEERASYKPQLPPFAPFTPFHRTVLGKHGERSPMTSARNSKDYSVDSAASTRDIMTSIRNARRSIIRQNMTRSSTKLR